MSPMSPSWGLGDSMQCLGLGKLLGQGVVVRCRGLSIMGMSVCVFSERTIWGLCRCNFPSSLYLVSHYPFVLSLIILFLIILCPTIPSPIIPASPAEIVLGFNPWKQSGRCKGLDCNLWLCDGFSIILSLPAIIPSSCLPASCFFHVSHPFVSRHYLSLSLYFVYHHPFILSPFMLPHIGLPLSPHLVSYLLSPSSFVFFDHVLRVVKALFVIFCCCWAAKLS